MRYARVIFPGVIAVFCFAQSSIATIRINGNQLVEAAADYDAAGARARRSPSAPQATSVVRRLVFNLGQGLTGRGDLTDSTTGAEVFAIGFGLVYDINNVALENNCMVSKTGDVNVTGSITSADVIFLVNYVFKSGLVPMPCQAAGDVNCNHAVTSSDIIYLVNYVFKGAAAPCDVCFLIPGLWSCP